MKKNIIIICLLVISLFTIVGCGKKNTKDNSKEDSTIVTVQKEKFELKNENKLNAMHYKENYVDFHTDAIGNIRTMSYTKEGNFIFEVRFMFDENRSEEELKATLEAQTGAKEKSKEINGNKYIYYEYKSEDGLTTHHYIHAHKGKLYSIAFFLTNKPGNIEEVFMNNVTFE